MIISDKEAKRLAQKVLSLSKADSASVSINGVNRGNVRFALNSVTTCGRAEDLSINITSNFGKRSGSVSTNELDEPSLAAAVRKSEEIARLAPEDPEFQPPLGQQKYLQSRVYFNSTAKADAGKLAELTEPVLNESIKEKVSSAGYLGAGATSSALATSNGLFVHQTSTISMFSVTSRTPDGTGSGWAGVTHHNIAKIDSAKLGKRAVEKSIQSRNPTALEPGKYTVILEPSAVADLVGWMTMEFDARSADEGRSFLSKKGGGNKLGEKLFRDQITLYSDPQHEEAPGNIYSSDGLPALRRSWVEGGVVKQLMYSRFWAQKQGKQPAPPPTNLIMQGGNTSIQEMVKNTKRGVLVTRLWYIREVDPATLLLTGLTRDGTFLIENGKITKPIKNFRFNESPVAMLNNVEAMGAPERAAGSELDDWSIFVPPLLVKDFTFSSLSDAI